MRAGLIVIGPAVAIAALVGDDLVQALLGASFTAADADRMIATFVALSGLYVAQLALPLPLLAAFALSRYWTVAALAAVGTAVHVAASAVAISVGGIVWLGVAASLSSLTTTTLMLWLIHRSQVHRALAIVLRETVVVGAVTAAAFVPPAIVAALLGAGVGGRGGGRRARRVRRAAADAAAAARGRRAADGRAGAAGGTARGRGLTRRRRALAGAAAADRDLGRDVRAAPGRAVDAQAPVERLDAVGSPRRPVPPEGRRRRRRRR